MPYSLIFIRSYAKLSLFEIIRSFTLEVGMKELMSLVTGNPVLSVLLLALPFLAIPATAGSGFLIKKEGIRNAVLVFIWGTAAIALFLFLYSFSLLWLNQ